MCIYFVVEMVPCCTSCLRFGHFVPPYGFLLAAPIVHENEESHAALAKLYSSQAGNKRQRSIVVSWCTRLPLFSTLRATFRSVSQYAPEMRLLGLSAPPRASVARLPEAGLLSILGRCIMSLAVIEAGIKAYFRFWKLAEQGCPKVRKP